MLATVWKALAIVIGYTLFGAVGFLLLFLWPVETVALLVVAVLLWLCVFVPGMKQERAEEEARPWCRGCLLHCFERDGRSCCCDKPVLKRSPSEGRP